MLLAHKIELRPTPEQVIYINKACGCRRHCFNQLLDHFRNKENPWSKAAANRYYIDVLRQQFPWYTEVSARATRNAIDDLDTAFSRFFDKKSHFVAFPRFKVKGRHDSFALREPEKFKVEGKTLKIERLKTKIKMRQALRFTGAPRQVTITQRAGRYFASILVEVENYATLQKAKFTNRLGTEKSLDHFMRQNKAIILFAFKRMKRTKARLARLQLKQGRQQKGSARQAKTKLALSKCYFRLSNQRKGIIHLITDRLTKQFIWVDVAALQERLSAFLDDLGGYELRRQLGYKGLLRGCEMDFVETAHSST